MANLNVTGPAYLYVSIPTRTMTNSATGIPAALSYPSASDIRFLGTSQTAPRISQQVVWEPVMNDITGQAIPMDQVYQGQAAQFAYTLTYWNESVLAVLDRIVDWDGDATARGTDEVGDIATLAIMEGQTFHCWVHFPYATGKTFQANFGMPTGYHYYACRQLNFQLDIGTTAQKRLFAIEAMPVYNPDNGSRKLYDGTFTSIPAFPPGNSAGTIV